MTKYLPTVLAISVLGLSSGCQSTLNRLGGLFSRTSGGKSELTTDTGAIPTSSRTYREVMERAFKLIEGDPTLRVGQVAATGSMRPYLGESALVIMETTSRDRLREGSLISFTRGGAEYLHILVSLAPEGAVTRGANPDTSEVVPYTAITGANVATLYFDPTTAPRDRSGPPIFLVASGTQVPASAGTLRILEAAMIAGTKAALVYPGRPGEYTVTLQREDALGITVGVPGVASIPTAEANIAWSAANAGKTVRYQVYHPDAPETGVILVDATFLR